MLQCVHIQYVTGPGITSPIGTLLYQEISIVNNPAITTPQHLTTAGQLEHSFMKDISLLSSSEVTYNW